MSLSLFPPGMESGGWEQLAEGVVGLGVVSDRAMESGLGASKRKLNSTESV